MFRIITVVDLMILLPEYFQQIKDFIALMATEKIELELIEAFIRRVYYNLFIQTADSDTISTYEAQLGIIPGPYDSLEFRRWRVLQRYKRSPPYTMPMLKELLNQMVGLGLWEIEQDLNNYYLRILIKTSDNQVFVEVQSTLLQLIPAHIEQDIRQQLAPESTGVIYYGAASSTGIRYILTT